MVGAGDKKSAAAERLLRFFLELSGLLPAPDWSLLVMEESLIGLSAEIKM